MKLNKISIMLASALTFSAVFAAQAVTNSGGSTVTFTGSIIDAPCTIAPESIDQTVSLGQVSKAVLAANSNTGTSTPVPFYIKLENCDTTTLKSAVTTFSGAVSQFSATELGMTGNAGGAFIRITDGTGTPIALGSGTQQQFLQNGNNNLSFSAYLVGGGASATIVPGTFQAVTDFTLAYQ